VSVVVGKGMSSSASRAAALHAWWQGWRSIDDDGGRVTACMLLMDCFAWFA
jgi:hypothetical protein